MSRGPQYYADCVGKRFHSLTVERFVGFKSRSDGRKRGDWECRCDCGNKINVTMQNLQNGNSRACGCTKRGKFNKRWRGHGDIGLTVWHQFIRGATDRDLPFELDIEWGWELYEKQERKCALSGLPIGFGTERRRNTASLDRIDSSKGYTEDNVQWVHKTINIMKQASSDDEFIRFCKAVANHHPDPCPIPTPTIPHGATAC